MQADGSLKSEDNHEDTVSPADNINAGDNYRWDGDECHLLHRRHPQLMIQRRFIITTKALPKIKARKK